MCNVFQITRTMRQNNKTVFGWESRDQTFKMGPVYLSTSWKAVSTGAPEQEPQRVQGGLWPSPKASLWQVELSSPHQHLFACKPYPMHPESVTNLRACTLQLDRSEMFTELYRDKKKEEGDRGGPKDKRGK